MSLVFYVIVASSSACGRAGCRSDRLRSGRLPSTDSADDEPVATASLHRFRRPADRHVGAPEEAGGKLAWLSWTGAGWPNQSVIRRAPAL